MQFKTALNLILVKEDDGGGALWKLASPLVWESDVIGTVVVPIDFETDLASVPRLPLTWLLAGGVGNAAAVVHDYLYTIKYPTKEVADNEFYHAMLYTKVPKWKAWCMYKAVSWFGERW